MNIKMHLYHSSDLENLRVLGTLYQKALKLYALGVPPISAAWVLLLWRVAHMCDLVGLVWLAPSLVGC